MQRTLFSERPARETIPSPLSESILVVRQCADIQELNMKEKKAIDAQDELANYVFVRKGVRTMGGIYGAASFVLKICGWIVL